MNRLYGRKGFDILTLHRANFSCRDNKKCDDNRPCMRCVTRNEECVHVERTPKTVKYRCVNCRKDNKKV